MPPKPLKRQWWRGRDSNPRPRDYETSRIPWQSMPCPVKRSKDASIWPMGYEAIVKHSRPVRALTRRIRRMARWRSIRADSIDWLENPISRRAGGYCRMMSNSIYINQHSDARSCGGWSNLTLGEIADLGIKHWMRCRNIGPLGVDVIKWIIDEAAAGRCPILATHGRAADAYDPRTPADGGDHG
jgi:hypothetical protein